MKDAVASEEPISVSGHDIASSEDMTLDRTIFRRIVMLSMILQTKVSPLTSPFLY